MNLLKKVLLTGALVASAGFSSAASAAQLLFTYTPTTDTSGAFSFKIDSSPTVIAFDSGSFLAPITDATGRLEGQTSEFFFTSAMGGLFNNLYGAQIFTGSTSAPTFITGTFNSTFDSPNNTDRAGIVTISAVTPAVPEPGTWLMMLVGFGAVGAALRRRPALRAQAKLAPAA